MLACPPCLRTQNYVEKQCLDHMMTVSSIKKVHENVAHMLVNDTEQVAEGLFDEVIKDPFENDIVKPLKNIIATTNHVLSP